MRKFRFSLEKLLGLKEAEERVQQAELAKCLQLVRSCKDELAALLRRRGELLSTFTPKVLSDLQVADRFLRKLDERIEAARVNLKEAEERLEQQRQTLMELTKERKALETLRAKEEARFQQELRSEEQRELDEIAARSH